MLNKTLTKMAKKLTLFYFHDIVLVYSIITMQKTDAIKNINPLMKACVLPFKDAAIQEIKEAYPYKETIELNWVYYTIFGLQRLRKILQLEGKEITTVAIIGIGSGIEGIAAISLFKETLKTLIVTDTESSIVRCAVKNIKSVCADSAVKITPFVGSFCEPLLKQKVKVDLVFGNMPNLPAPEGYTLTLGIEKGTFMDTHHYMPYNPPKKFMRFALGTQYVFLQSAKACLTKGGSVVVALGGRPPIPLIDELFSSCNLRVQELVVGFKEQSEALIDFIGYYEIEKEYGVVFDFYRFAESKKALAENNIVNPTSVCQGKEIKKLLTPYRVSAHDALKAYHKGVLAGHTVHILRGYE
jgi:hypothetical protein